MESPMRPGRRVMATIGLLLIVCLAGVAILAPIQPTALRANKAHTLTTFATYVLSLTHSLINEATLLATLPGDDATVPEPAKRLADAAARTDHARQALEKAWGRFNSKPFGTQLRVDLEQAVSNLDTVKRLPRPTATDVRDAAQMLRSYNIAVGHFIEALLHIDGLAFSDDKLLSSRAEFARHAVLARTFSREIAFGAAHYADAKLDPKSAARWADVVSRRDALLETASASPADRQTIQLAAAYGDLLFSSATRDEAAKPPDFSVWAASMLRAIASTQTHVNSSINEIRTRAEQRATEADRAFIAVLVIGLALALCIATWRNDMTPLQGFLALAAMTNAALFAWHFGSESSYLSSEGGPLEVGQTLALLLAALFFARETAKGGQAVGPAAFIMMIVCVMMFFRELEFRAMGIPEDMLQLFDFPGRRLLYYAAAVAIGVIAIVNRRQLLSLSPQRFIPKRWPLYLWPVLLFFGEVTEYIAHKTRKDDLHGYWATGRFWEELLELNAYVLLGFAAFFFATLLKTNGTARGK